MVSALLVALLVALIDTLLVALLANEGRFQVRSSHMLWFMVSFFG